MKKIILMVAIILGLAGLVTGGYLWWKKSANKKTQSNQSPTTTPNKTKINKIKIKTSYYDGNFIDTHAHLITRGFSFTETIDELKKYGIDKMILMATPVDLSHILPSSAHGIPEAAKYSQFAMMYQGEAIEMLHKAVKKGSYTANEKKKFIRLLEKAAKSGQYVGFGELAVRHYPQPNLMGAKREARDITIAGNHPWMLELADIGAKYGMPLDIHIEPDDTTISGFKKLIAHNQSAKIIFDHAGWYNTGEGTPELFDRLLGKYPNLYANIKIRKPVSAAQQTVAIFDKNNKIRDQWLAVFKKYPNRFMMGTDVKFGLEAGEGNYENILSGAQNFFSQLPADLGQKIALDNPKAVFNLTK